MVWYDPLCCQPITQVEATTGMKYTGFNYMMFTNNQFSDVVCADLSVYYSTNSAYIHSLYTQSM